MKNPYITPAPLKFRREILAYSIHGTYGILSNAILEKSIMVKQFIMKCSFFPTNVHVWLMRLPSMSHGGRLKPSS